MNLHVGTNIDERVDLRNGHSRSGFLCSCLALGISRGRQFRIHFAHLESVSTIRHRPFILETNNCGTLFLVQAASCFWWHFGTGFKFVSFNCELFLRTKNVPDFKGVLVPRAVAAMLAGVPVEYAGVATLHNAAAARLQVVM